MLVIKDKPMLWQMLLGLRLCRLEFFTLRRGDRKTLSTTTSIVEVTLSAQRLD
jgi:hypothetical protein